MRSKQSAATVKHHFSFVLVGTMKLKRTLSDSRADAWPTLFFGEHYALCVCCVIDSTAVAMIYILKISCYASMVNKKAMTFILLVLSSLVCSGYTLNFLKERLSASFILFKVVKIQFLSLIIDILARTRRGFPPKWEIRPSQGSKICLLARDKAVHCEDMKVVSHFGALAPKNQEKFELNWGCFFFLSFWNNKSEVPVGSSKGTHSVLLRWSLLRCLI